MPKNKPKTSKDELRDENMREMARGFDFGSGAEVSITSHSSPEDKKGAVTYFFSSKLPKADIGSKKIKKELEIECSSTDKDNQSLLHFLFKKIN